MPYGGIPLPPYMQDKLCQNCVNMQHIQGNRRLIYVNMQHLDKILFL